MAKRVMLFLLGWSVELMILLPEHGSHWPCSVRCKARGSTFATSASSQGTSAVAKPDAQTVAQMAATITSGLVMGVSSLSIDIKVVATDSVTLARAIVAEVERTQPEEKA